MVQRGSAKVALMQTRDKVAPSQITEFVHRYGYPLISPATGSLKQITASSRLSQAIM